MKRRDFLMFRTEQRLRIAELSCERLYMRFVDAQTIAESAHDAIDCDPSDGEPPARLEIPTARQLFAELDRELEGVDIVRVRGREWLASDDFRREFDSLLSSVRARGGRVENL